MTREAWVAKHPYLRSMDFGDAAAAEIFIPNASVPMWRETIFATSTLVYLSPDFSPYDRALFLLLSNLLRSQWANDRRQKSRFWGCGSHPLFIASFIASSHPPDAAFPHFTALKGLLRY
jgi:hypothetical protein